MNEENTEYIKELFGNVDSFLRYYDKIPEEDKIRNEAKNEALDKAGMVCWYCLNRKIFTECKNFVKRTVDNCNRALGEDVIKNMRFVRSLSNDDKKKLERVLNEIANKEVSE